MPKAQGASVAKWN